MKNVRILLIGLCSLLVLGAFNYKQKVTTIYLIGDSTVADYSLE